MKEVRFILEEFPIIQYDKEEFKALLRDKFVQYLVKCSLEKLDLGEISSRSELIKYISAVFYNALEAKLSRRELDKIESMQTKFPFLQYHKTAIDNIIHGTAYNLAALCSGDKKTVEIMLSRSHILDVDGNILSLRKGLSWEHSKALCNDVANLTRDCIRELLHELRETGRIMTSTELVEHRLSLTSSNTTEEESYSNDEFEPDEDAIKTEATAKATNGTQEDSHLSDESETSIDSDNDPVAATDGTSNGNIDQKIEASLSITDVKDSNANTNIVTTQAQDNPEPNALLNHLLAWIYELPEWLQEQILNSTPIRNLIESAEQITKIYDVKPINKVDIQNLTPEPQSSVDAHESDFHEKVKISDTRPIESIDMTLLYEGVTLTGWILPTIGPESGNIFGGDTFFNGLEHFHGHEIGVF